MLDRLNLSSLKNMDMSRVKTLGNDAMSQLRQLGSRRVTLAGRSMSPMVIGGAALALIAGGYLLMRRRNRHRHQFAGATAMQPQVQPVK